MSYRHLTVPSSLKCGKQVSLPQLLHMNQGALPGTEEKMLQGRNHEQIVFAIHGF